MLDMSENMLTIQSVVANTVAVTFGDVKVSRWASHGGEEVTVFVNGSSVGIIGWMDVRSERYSEKRHAEFFVEGPRIERKGNVHYSAQAHRRESKNAKNLAKFVRDGFRADTPWEVYAELRRRDADTHNAQAAKNKAYKGLQDRDVSIDMWMRLMVVASFSDDAQLRELATIHQGHRSDLDDADDIINRRTIEMKVEAGVIIPE